MLVSGRIIIKGENMQDGHYGTLSDSDLLSTILQCTTPAEITSQLTPANIRKLIDYQFSGNEANIKALVNKIANNGNESGALMAVLTVVACKQLPNCMQMFASPALRCCKDAMNIILGTTLDQSIAMIDRSSIMHKYSVFVSATSGAKNNMLVAAFDTVKDGYSRMNKSISIKLGVSMTLSASSIALIAIGALTESCWLEPDGYSSHWVCVPQSGLAVLGGLLSPVALYGAATALYQKFIGGKCVSNVGRELIAGPFMAINSRHLQNTAERSNKVAGDMLST